MKTRDATKRSAKPNNTPTGHSRRRAWRFLPLLLLLILSVTVQAQFNYTVSQGKVTITKYTGPGGAVTIPDTIGGLPVTSIGGGAFYECTGVTSVTIPDSVTSIGDGAFSWCTGLTSIIIPDSVTSIGVDAFMFCSALMSVTIPNSVTSIRDAAFASCTGLTSVTIGNRVTSIGWAAFAWCAGLASVTIPNSVTSIEYEAFYGCTGLTSIIIPDSVTSIGSSAFYGCTSLTSITIGSSVTSIGGGAFYGCTNLRGVYFQGNAPSEVGWNVLSWTSAMVYYLPGTTGWGPTFDGHPAISGYGASVLEIVLYPGLRVTGEVGTTYVIESKTDVDGDFWLTRGWIELTTPTAIWMDPVPTDSPRKVYRAVKVAKPVVQTVANMVWVPPGTFVMGSPETERGRWDVEGPQTRVTLTKGFWMGKYEVTVGEYLALMGEAPCYDPENPGDLDMPVACVSWDDAVEYCQKLTEQEQTAGRLPAGYAYRLPTEAEWEYACRAGTTTRYSFGDALGCSDECEYCTLFDSYMWWCGNGWAGRVGQKLANPWGLYDIHGNVAEWCQDWWGDYPGGAVVDPQGPSAGSDRVIRGGRRWLNWLGPRVLAGGCRSAYRFSGAQGRYSDLGFRAVLAPGQ